VRLVSPWNGASGGLVWREHFCIEGSCESWHRISSLVQPTMGVPSPWRLNLINLKQTVRTRISETCIGTSITLGRVTSLELMS
jgi:hypothetical protein